MAIKLTRALLLAALGSLVISASAQADSMNATMLSNPCAGCHGTDGESFGGMPSIKGKTYEFIVRTLKEFRSGKRNSTVMDRIAKGYTDEQIKLLADHYSSLK